MAVVVLRDWFPPDKQRDFPSTATGGECGVSYVAVAEELRFRCVQTRAVLLYLPGWM